VKRRYRNAVFGVTTACNTYTLSIADLGCRWIEFQELRGLSQDQELRVCDAGDIPLSALTALAMEALEVAVLF
jgi:hypothetical protein